MNIIGAVLVRPAMYTISGSFGEIIAFLDGYTSGVAKHRLDVDFVVEWSDFRSWLANQIHTSQSDVFVDLWKQLGNDAEALAYLRQSYQDFKVAHYTEA